MTSNTPSVPDRDGQSARTEAEDAATEPTPTSTATPADAAPVPEDTADRTPAPVTAAAATAEAEQDAAPEESPAAPTEPAAAEPAPTEPAAAEPAGDEAAAAEPAGDELASDDGVTDAEVGPSDEAPAAAAPPATPKPSERRPPRWAVGAATTGVLAVVGVVGTLAFNQDTSEQTPPGTTVGSTAAPAVPAAAPSASPSAQWNAPKVPQPPGFVLPTLNGSGTVRLDDLRGKPTVVNLFASWCDVCDLELPAFVKLSKELDGKVHFVGVNSMETGDRNLMAKRHNLASWKLARDIGPRGRAYHDQIAPGFGGMPVTAFYDADGKLVHVQRGGLLEDDLRDAIEDAYGKLN